MKISKIEFVITWMICRLYLALATMAAVAATCIIYIGNALNVRGQGLAEYLKEMANHGQN